MKFRPLHDRVVVKRIEAEEKTTGGEALGWASLSAMISLLNNTPGLSKAYDSRGFRAKSKCVSEKPNESLHPRSRR